MRSKKKHSSLLLRCIRNKAVIAWVLLLGVGFIYAINASDGFVCIDCDQRREVELGLVSESDTASDKVDDELSSNLAEGTATNNAYYHILNNQEDENKRLLLQRELRNLVSKAEGDHLLVGEKYSCIATFQKGKAFRVDNCESDFIAKRLISRKLDGISADKVFVGHGFATDEPISVSLGNLF